MTFLKWCKLLGIQVNNINHNYKMTTDKQAKEIRFITSFSNTIYDVLISKGWKDVNESSDSQITNPINQIHFQKPSPTAPSDNTWDIAWCDRDNIFELFDGNQLLRNQKINHFRNSRELCRKDLLIKNLKRRQKQLEKERNIEEWRSFHFFPLTFCLPKEYSLFVEEFKKCNSRLWIMKPVGSAQGKGIFLFSKLSEISHWKQSPLDNHHQYHRTNSGIHNLKQNNKEKESNKKLSSQSHQQTTAESYVVQKYIDNPFLIGGKKFDIRIFALVTSYSPLTVWLYRSGFARFSNAQYSNDLSDLTNSTIHLTNVSIQKKNMDNNESGKWELRKLKLHMMCTIDNGREKIDELFHEMEMIVCRSLQSVEHIMIQDRRCFELYGYDIMIDESLKPWLIEVNASPSLSGSNEEDYHMKFNMLNDVLNIVSDEGITVKDPLRCGGFDLIYKGVYLPMNSMSKRSNTHSGWKTYLGSCIQK